MLPTHDIHPQLQSVAGRLSVWRSTRQRGQRIPEDLWNAAVTLARSHGLNPTASALNLNYYDLQRRLGSAPVHGGAAPVPPGFVELAAPSPGNPDRRRHPGTGAAFGFACDPAIDR